jgi:NADH dehydrogenase
VSESSRAGTSVLVVGGGFAGAACARKLGEHDVAVTLIDQHNYNQFQPLLYQVATAQLPPSDVARPMRWLFRRHRGVDVKLGHVTAIDPVAKTATCHDGTVFSGDYLVLAMGAEPNFFDTPGADTHAFPLYALADAERLRSRFLGVLEDAYRDPTLLEQGALNYVIVGAGATGVEIAGAVSDVFERLIPNRVPGFPRDRVQIHLVDPGKTVLAPFSERAQTYAQKVLEGRGVTLDLGVSVTDIASDRVTLSDGREILTRTVVWAGGIQAARLASGAGLPQGHGGRVDVQEDLTVSGFPGVYALGDVANTLGPDGKPFPQLGSVALQAGRWAAQNILADMDGKERTPFRYRDKGIMAMIGRNAAIAEMGKRRRELHGTPAFASWLGVHVALLSGYRERVNALRGWAWNYVSKKRGAALLDRPDAAAIQWRRSSAPPSGRS